MKKLFLFLITYIISCSLYSSDYEYKFRLTLKDKGQTAYNIDKPEEFLSPKAIERRAKHNIKIDESDLPISSQYLQEIEDLGGVIVAKSKWNKTIAVHVEDSTMVEHFKALPFVQDAKFVWRDFSRITISLVDTIESYPILEDSIADNYYGYAYDNIKMLNGDTLHNAGFKGEGIVIGVIDAGFNNFDKIEYLNNINVLGHKSFVYENKNLFKQKNQHGTNVVSCIATNKPYRHVGTAPHAQFWLLGSEDSSSEYPIEEDYWAAAIEYADSVGVDVVNTSLGYTNFDYPAESFNRKGLDGKTALISRAANLASRKGMFLVISAGNSGRKEWSKVSSPADAEGILTVGSVMRDSIISAFSSRGLTADLRIKPDVVALGSNSVLIDDEGTISEKSGTSFSSPIMCGMVACLWQAYPILTNYELLDVLRESSDRFDDPSTIYGFGIPDMKKAMKLAQNAVELKKQLKKK